MVLRGGTIKAARIHDEPGRKGIVHIRDDGTLALELPRFDGHLS